MPSSAPVAVIDALNSLLEAEVNSILRFMGAGYPHMDRTTAEIRRPLQDMLARRERRITTLASLIESLGGVPNTAPPGVDPEEQYLAFLSLKFLLPRLIHGKRLIFERYDNTLRALRAQKDVDPEVLRTIEEMTEEHRAGIERLEKVKA
jgi:hypothetical protein